MKFDLHNHSYYSDGKHSPKFVLDRAKDNGVTHLALTDHDCIEGLLDLRDHHSLSGIELINGVEISTLWNGIEIHIVGLCINSNDAVLNSLLTTQQEKRRSRINQIHLAMEKAGISGLDRYMSTQHCVSPSRSHIAEFLMVQRKIRSRKNAFKSLLKNGRFYAKPDWCSIAEAIGSIKQAGGLAVLAHPHRYQMTNTKLKRLISDFRDFNGDAIEVCYSNVGDDVSNFLARLSVEFELSASIGSDFHDEKATWMDIGKLPCLPEICNKNAIWLHPRWHLN